MNLLSITLLLGRKEKSEKELADEEIAFLLRKFPLSEARKIPFSQKLGSVFAR